MSEASATTDAAAPTVITVPGEHPYDVVIGRHLLGELPRLLGERVRRVLSVHPGALATSAEAVREDLVGQGYQAFLAEIPEAEEAKTVQVASRSEMTEVAPGRPPLAWPPVGLTPDLRHFGRAVFRKGGISEGRDFGRTGAVGRRLAGCHTL